MLQKKIKVAIIHLGFIYSGGGERLVLQEAIGLEKLGYEVTCFAPVIDKERCFPEFMEKVQMQRLLPKILPSWFPDRELFSILAACILAPLLFYRFKEFDFYFGANQPGPWIAYLLSKINHKPYAIYLAQPTRLIHPRLIDQQVGLRIKSDHTLLNMLNFIFKPLITILDVKSIQRAGVIFANGSYAKGILEEVYNVKTICCPAGSIIKNTSNITKNDINKRFKGIIKLKKRTIKKPYILITNRHFPQKKFEYAIEAASLLKRGIPLIITGKETSYTKRLKEKYKNTTIKFVGLCSEEELQYLYENTAVYAYPAPEEDFGMGIIEAMANKVPVVAWENGGPTGIIESEIDGLLAKPFDIADFSDKLEKLLTNRPYYEKIAKNAFKKVEKQFSYTAHTKTLKDNIEKYYLYWVKKNKATSELRSSFKKNTQRRELAFLQQNKI